MYCLKCLDVQTITACDMEQGLIDSMNHCLDRNGLDPQRITGRLWDWSQPFSANAKQGESTTFDVAIGADLVWNWPPFFFPPFFHCIIVDSNAYHQIYDPDVIPLLLSAIQDLFKNHGIKQFVISATLRNRATFEMFLHGCGT